MSYQVDGIVFDLSNPISKFWFSKHKKQLTKNNLEYIKDVLEDARNKKQIKYSPKYFACAKFIKNTTNLKYKKINIYLN